jgi:DNA primase
MFIDFKAIKAAVSIEDAANLLKLPLKKSGSQFRTVCPACASDDERTIVLTPSRQLWYCFDAKVGGDCIALVQHITGLDAKDAASYLAPQEQTRSAEIPRTSKATVPQKPEGRKQPASPSREFDPAAFAAKLSYSDEVAELGLTEEDATRLGIGSVRGKVYFPMKDDTGFICGFIGWGNGELKLPPKWLEQNKVVKLKRA